MTIYPLPPCGGGLGWGDLAAQTFCWNRGSAPPPTQPPPQGGRGDCLSNAIARRREDIGRNFEDFSRCPCLLGSRGIKRHQRCADRSIEALTPGGASR